MMRMIALLFAIALMAPTARADTLGDCNAAIAADDKVAAGKAAEVILGYAPGRYTRSAEILTCLSFAKGEPYAFDETTFKFRPASVIANEAEKRAAAAAERLREYEDAQRQIRIAEEAARQAERDEKARREAKRAAVTVRLIDACTELYRTHPDETITNKLCFDVFLQIGLPE